MVLSRLACSSQEDHPWCHSSALLEVAQGCAAAMVRHYLYY